MSQEQERGRPIRFMGDSLKTLRDFPEAVRQDVGLQLRTVQRGRTPENAKPLKGLPGVLEIVKRHDKDTYRAVYAAQIGETVFVLHCFMKKSKHGIATPKPDIDLIRQRYRDAKASQEEQR